MPCQSTEGTGGKVINFTHAMTILATQGWEKTASPSFGHASLEEICHCFAIPLDKASIDSSAVQEEWNLVQDDYKVIW